MRKLVLAMFMSLDGYIEGPNAEFVPPDWSDEMQKEWSDDTMGRVDLLIYGRKNYEFNSAFWQAAEADPNSSDDQRGFARLMNQTPKLVVSSSLKEVGWNGRLAGADLAADVTALKAEDGKDIVALGGAGLANSLMRLGLVDEYKLLITPTFLGGGTRLFQDGPTREKLQLVSAKAVDTGSVILVYRPA